MCPLGRHRDISGREERKKNNTKIESLRKIYGDNFADEYRSDMKLRTLKKRLGLPEDASLNEVRAKLKE